MHVQKRSLWLMLVLMILTGPFYFFYWQYVTKRDINKLGGKVPSLWFAIFPFLNIYFDYRYAQEYVRIIRKQQDNILVWLYFLLILCLPIFAPFVIQYELNNVSERSLS